MKIKSSKINYTQNESKDNKRSRLGHLIHKVWRMKKKKVQFKTVFETELPSTYI